MRKDILIVLHQEHSTPGRVGQMLVQKGYALDIRKPRFGDPLPDTMDAHKAAIIFGGPMSANDPDDYVKTEIDWCGVPLSEEAPFLGICLGAQMLAKKLGARVFEHPQGMAEIGYYPVHDLRPAGHNGVLPPTPSHFYQWHREGFEDLPDGADLLVAGDIFENQAFSFGETAFGIQFHTELTLAMLHRWTVKASERLEMPGAQKRPDHMRGRLIYDPPIRLWLDKFLDNWLATDAR